MVKSRLLVFSRAMPVDSTYTDPFSSPFLESASSSFSLNKNSATPQLNNTSMDRKRKYFPDDDEDMSSILAARKFLGYSDPDLRPDEETDFLKMSSESKSSASSLDVTDNLGDKRNPSLHDFYGFVNETDQQMITSAKKQGTRLLGEDRAVPSDMGTRAVPNDLGTRAVPNDMGTRAVPNYMGTRAGPNDMGTRAGPNDMNTRAVPNDMGTRAVPNDMGTRAGPNDMNTRAVPNDMGTRAVPNDLGTRAGPNDVGTRAVPIDMGSRTVANELDSRATTSEARSREDLASILSNLPSRDRMDDIDQEDGRQDSSSFASLPMKKVVENLAQQISDRMVRDWSSVFSKMECYEMANVDQLDQILRAALAYEEKLKSEKAELRNFVMKLSDVLQHD